MTTTTNYSVRVAGTEQELEQAYRVRHQVYCHELGWESPRPDGLETDEHDGRSAHVLLWDDRTETAVGCVRVVFPANDAEIGPLPFEAHFHGGATAQSIRRMRIPRQQMAEISRFALLPEARGDRLGLQMLVTGALVVAQILGAGHAFCIMEPWLGKALERVTITWQPLGDPIEHRGVRQLYQRNLNAMFLGMSPMLRDNAEQIALGFLQQTRRAAVQ